MKKPGPDTFPRTKEGRAKFHARIRLVGKQMLSAGLPVAAVARRFDMGYHAIRRILRSGPGL